MKILLYLFSVVVVACLLSSSALALTPIGPPAATLDEGQFAAGFGYSFSQVDVKVNLLGLTATVKDTEVETCLANMIYGLAPSWEIQVDVGSSYSETDGNKSKGDFAWGVDVKNTFWEREKTKWGAAIMAHWYQASGSGVTLGVPWQEEDKWTEIQFAIGPTYKEGAWCLYGGALLHFIDGEGEATIAGVRVSGDIEQDSMFGGFIGVQVDVAANAVLGVELQITGSAHAIGAGMLWRF